jgi:hypothetical protein
MGYKVVAFELSRVVSYQETATVHVKVNIPEGSEFNEDDYCIEDVARELIEENSDCLFDHGDWETQDLIDVENYEVESAYEEHTNYPDIEVEITDEDYLVARSDDDEEEGEKEESKRPWQGVV